MSPQSKRAHAPIEQTAPAGKRRASRKRRTLSIECRGPGGLRVEARTVDVSRGGTLIEITDPEIFSTDRSAPFAGRAKEFETLFPDGIDVSFGEGAVLAFARIIRHVVDADRPELVLLGCQFAPELSPVDCRLLGIEFENREATGSDAADGTSSSMRRDGDELVAFISTPGRSWSAPDEPTDSSPVHAPSPASPLGANLVYGAKSRATEVVVPKAHAAVHCRELIDAPVVLPVAVPVSTPSPAGEGLTDEDLRHMGRERRRAPASAVGGKAAEWAGAGRVAVYLFPSMAGATAPRYHGRLEIFDERHVVVDLPVPPSDSDPVGHGAGLGENVRAVFVRDGHVLGESNCRVTRLSEIEGGALRATLVPAQKLSDSLQKAVLRA